MTSAAQLPSRFASARLRSVRLFASGLNIASAALFVVTFARMLVICGADPIVGHSNPLDFFRQSACVGLWVHYTDRPKLSAKLDGPVADLVYDGDRRPGLCMHSSDNLFPWLTAHAYAPGSRVPLQAVGLWKAAVATGLVAFVLLQPLAPVVRLALAVLFLLVLGDFDLLCYFNSLFVDASFIVFGAAGLALAVVLAARQRRPGSAFTLVASAVLFWLGAVKPQYTFVAIVFALICALILGRIWQSWRRALLIGAAGLAGAALYFSLNSGPDSIMRWADRANRIDTIFGAILPAAANPQDALARLGLPARCAALSGSVATPGFDPANICPEIGSASVLRYPGLFVHDPATFFMPLLKEVPLTRTARFPPGEFARAADAERPLFRMIEATSLSSLLDRVPIGIYSTVIMLSCLCALLIPGWLVAVVAGRLGGVSGAALTLLASGGFVSFYAVLSSAFGDGPSDAHRHALGVLLGLSAQIATLVLLVPALRRTTQELRAANARHDLESACHPGA